MWDKVGKALAELLWPILKEAIAKYAHELIEALVEAIKRWLTNRNDSNTSFAEEKAEEAEAAARRAEDAKEAEKHEAVAKAWREVAEMFRRENDLLRSELDGLRKKAEQGNVKALEGLKFDDVVSEKDGKLSTSNALPHFPKDF